MCRSCQYAHGFVSYADITVGDFWRNSRDRIRLGSEFAPENGCNIISVNTEKGAAAFEEIKGSIVYRELFTSASEKIEAIYNKMNEDNSSGKDA